MLWSSIQEFYELRRIPSEEYLKSKNRNTWLNFSKAESNIIKWKVWNLGGLSLKPSEAMIFLQNY